MKLLIQTVSLSLLLSAGLRAEPPPVPRSTPEESPLAIENTQVVTEGIIGAPISEVWRVFSTAEGFKALGVAQAKMDFRLGGLILSSYDAKAELGDDRTIQTEIITYEPGRLLVTRIQRPPAGFPFTNAYQHVWTVITLTDVGDGRTNLRLSMNGYGPDEESQKMRAFFASGNDWVLKKLQSKYETAAAAPRGPAHADSPTGVIDLTRLVAAPRADVWKTLTTAAGWKAFFGVESKIGAQPGDPFEPFPGTEGCKLLSVAPGELLSFTWNAPSRFAFAKTHPTWVVVSLEAVSPRVTKLRLRHFGFAEQAAAYAEHAKEFEEARAYFSTAWPKVMDGLTTHFSPTSATAAK